MNASSKTVIWQWAVILLAFVSSSPMQAAPLDPRFGVGSWIWDRKVHDRQECRFVRAFSIPKDAKIKSASLRVTADNSYQLFLDGEAIGKGGDWRVLIEYDVSLLLIPGEHLLKVDAVNDFDAAGFLFGLHIVLLDGSVIDIASDASWHLAPNDVTEWEKEIAAWNHWPTATVERVFNPKELVYPLVYHAPISQPARIELWQRRWFRVALSAFAAANVVLGLFLASRLFLKTQTERVVSRERARIAMDLHDGLGGGLTHLLLIGEVPRPQNQEALEAAKALTKQMCDQSRELLREMNETVWLINSQRDTSRDFASYVAKYAESFFQGSAIRCRLEVQEGMMPVPCDLGIRRNLFLAIKEAMNNVLRHSRATVVQIEIRSHRQELIVVVLDDGRGFDLAAQSSGNGFRNMRQRAAEAGARFVVESSAGKGCRLEFRVSLATDRLGLAWFFRWPRPRSSK